MPGAPVDRGLPRRRRLRSARDFRQVYRRGRRVQGANLVLVALPRTASGSRLGLSVSKAHGPAVRRNKIKRLFREAFRLERAGFTGSFDLVMIPQPRASYALAEIRAELAALLQRLQTRTTRAARKRP
jgi:ribonuclease P protein component